MELSSGSKVEAMISLGTSNSDYVIIDGVATIWYSDNAAVQCSSLDGSKLELTIFESSNGLVNIHSKQLEVNPNNVTDIGQPGVVDP